MVVVLEGGVDFIAGGRCAGGKGKDAADGSYVEQRVQFVARADQRLEAYLFAAGAQVADDFDRSGRGIDSGRGQRSGGDESAGRRLDCIRRGVCAGFCDTFWAASCAVFRSMRAVTGWKSWVVLGLALDVACALDDAFDLRQIA